METALDIEAALDRAEDADVFNPPPLLFVGGTGRSGTHVVAKILNNHSHFRKVPNEARFHTDPGGIPDVLGVHDHPVEVEDDRLFGRARHGARFYTGKERRTGRSPEAHIPGWIRCPGR